MPQREKLTVEKRTVLGKNVKRMRKQGLLPANIYGKGLESTSVQVPTKEFEALFKEVGETGLIDVVLDGQSHPVLIKNIQIASVTRKILHAEFYQVNLKEKIKAMIPVEVVGEPKAVTDKLGLLLQTLSEVEVEALPEDLPEKFELNVEHLAAIDEQVTVADLKAPQGVEILTEAEQVVAKISELVSKEAEADAAAAEAAATAASTEGEATAESAEGASSPEGEGEKPASGDEKTKEESKSEEK